jgi:hypothetical protein
MVSSKTFIAALAAAVAVALSPVTELSAAPFGPGSPLPSSDLQLVQAKKKAARKTPKKKMKVAAAAKSCGTFMYRKGGKCLDARDK